MNASDFIKQREIRLRGPHPGLTDEDLQQLAELPGVLAVSAPSPYVLRIRYDLRRICLRGILEILQSLGLHLDASLWSKLRYALAFYSEDAQRENMQLPISQPEAIRELAAHLHVSHPNRIPHQDGAWERYL